MKYLYSRSLPGAVSSEPPKTKKKRGPKKAVAPKPATPKPAVVNSKPQLPIAQPSTKATPSFNAQNITPLPSPSELQQIIKNGKQTSDLSMSSQPSHSNLPSAAKKSSNPIPPPKSMTGDTNTIPQPEKRNNKENTDIRIESTQPNVIKPINKQTINSQNPTEGNAAKNNTPSTTNTSEPSKQTEPEKKANSTQKSSPSKSTEQSKVIDVSNTMDTPQTTAEPITRTRMKKAKLAVQEDLIEESQTCKPSKPASTATRTRAANKEEKTASTSRRPGRPSLKSTEKKLPTKRGRKRVIDSENEDDDLPVQPRKRTTTARRQNKVLPILNETYKLSMVFQGHTDINIPAKSIDDDDLTDAKDIWCCEFEPPRKGQLVHNVVAICGSYSVLLLDTQQGRYIKKFTHAEIQEIFYCMAWTTLTGPQLLNSDVGADESCNILAVAGRLGSIKLLNPLQNECYRYLFGHNQAVLKLAFAKTEPRWLFSASADKTVRLWDIGSPTSKDDDSVCLAKFNLPSKTSVPSALHISHDLSSLIVGFDDGDMVSFKISSQLLEKFRTKSANLRDKESRTGDKWHDFGPIATIEPKTVYPKGEEWHAGYIDDVYIFGQDGNKSNRLYNKILSRGADDMEFIIWDPAKSTKSDADIWIALEWPESAGCTGARYKVIEADGQKVLIAGEYDGQVYIYNIGDMKNSKTLPDGSLEQYKPTRMLSHPMSSELIRDVCCSHDTRTIVAVDNNNTAFIWNCTEQN